MKTLCPVSGPNHPINVQELIELQLEKKVFEDRYYNTHNINEGIKWLL